MSITVQNVSKMYGTQYAVNNISFSINPGEIVGFLGPNGAGKSTTMKIITGYLQPTTGTAQVCNIAVHKNQTATKQKIGYLPEANPLYMDMYVREYLQFVANVHQLTNSKDAIEKVITTVGLTLEANKKIGQLSKGYKQRVGLAAALIHNPQVLILDEPTTGLDPNQIIEIRNVIKTLSKDKTILFSSHILQEVEAICDRVIIINKGQIVADDKLANLQNTTNQQQIITVAFMEHVEYSILQSIPTVTTITSPQPNTYILTCTNADTVKKELLQIAVQHNYNITTLQSQTQSLETIFKQLTTT